MMSAPCRSFQKVMRWGDWLWLILMLCGVPSNTNPSTDLTSFAVTVMPSVRPSMTIWPAESVV